VLQVLGGEVNAILVAALQRAGVDAVGLTGADGGLFDADVVDPALGHVGAVSRVDGGVLERLGDAGFVPVVSTVTPSGGAADVFLNVNADMAVGPLAAAWGADAVLFLSDVPHVKDGDARIASLDAEATSRLVDAGVIAGGMIPKVEAALAAADALPTAAVKIATGSGDDPIAAALDPGLGTTVTTCKEEIGRG
jgi:acetylglutamate kinase